MKKLYPIFLIFSTSVIFCVVITLFGQTARQGFDRYHYERLLRTKRCIGCYLYHAKLSHIDLTGANLEGAALSGATFRYATLKNANLKGAQINGTNFSGADLSGAIWVDGRQCAAGSIGRCKQ